MRARATRDGAVISQFHAAAAVAAESSLGRLALETGVVIAHLVVATVFPCPEATGRTTNT